MCACLVRQLLSTYGCLLCGFPLVTPGTDTKPLVVAPHTSVPLRNPVVYPLEYVVILTTCDLVLMAYLHQVSRYQSMCPRRPHQQMHPIWNGQFCDFFAVGPRLYFNQRKHGAVRESPFSNLVEVMFFIVVGQVSTFGDCAT